MASEKSRTEISFLKSSLSVLGSIVERIKDSNKIIQDFIVRRVGDQLTAIEKANYLGAAKMIAGGTTQSVPMMSAAM